MFFDSYSTRKWMCDIAGKDFNIKPLLAKVSKEVNICVGYKNAAGEEVGVPSHSDDFEGLQPIYETMPGWSEVTVGAQDIDSLPANARNYIARIEELVGAPVDVVSTGPDRVETIVLRHAFA